MSINNMLALDRSLGPGYGDSFDFSLTFESAILTIAPLGVLIAACPFHILHYRKKPVVAKTGAHFWLLTVVAIALFSLEVAKAVVWSIAPGGTYAIFEASTALSAVGAAALLLMHTLEYRHSTHSSYISSAMMSAAFCVDIIKTRSFFMRDGLTTIAALSVAVATSKLIIIMLQEFPKPLCNPTDHILSQEATCGFWVQTLAIWVSPTMRLGRRQALAMNNLSALGPDYSSERLSSEFDIIWARQDKTSQWALINTCIVAFRWTLGPAVFSHMLTTACEWAQAFSIQTIVASLGQAQPRWRPTSLILATVAIYSIKMATISMTTYYINKTSTLTRGLLVSQITKKNFALTLASAQKTQAVTLMSTDVEQICDLIIELHEFVTAIPAVAFCLYFIYRMVGVAFVLTFSIALVGCLIATLMTKPAAQAQKQWVQAIQERVAQMSIVLLQLKGIKMLGLQTILIEFMQRSRETEIKRSLRIRYLRMISQANHSVETVWTMTAGFVGGVFWTRWRDGLDASSLYTYLSLAALFQGPLRALILNSPMLGGAFSNFVRIQEFLLQSEREDPRQLFDRMHTLSLDVDEKGASESSSDTSEKMPLAAKTVQILVNNLTVAALSGEKSTNVLEKVSFEIAAASLTIIIGPVGCGKSTLLRTLLGETALSSGTIKMRTDNMAFCHQSAWIPNCTIRQAIIGTNEYDHKWYQEVLKVSALDYDVGKITDQAKTGNNNGGLLSGGQKQRIALARAIYSRAPILILDDILSALDQSTAKLIFSRLLAPDGLLKRQGRTVILATHAVEWLSDADQILVLDSSGHISSHVDKNDIIAVKAAALSSQKHDKDKDMEEEVVLKLEEESNGAEEKIDTLLATDKSLYRLLFGTVPRYLLVTTATSALAWQVLSTWNELWSRIWLVIGPMNKLLVAPLLVGVFIHVVNSVFMVWIWQVVTMPKIANKMHKLFLDAVMTATLPFLSKSRSGALLNRFSQDMTLFAFKLPHGVFRVFLSLTIVIIQCVYLISGSFYTVAFIPLLLAILWVLQTFYLKTSRQIRILDLETKTPLFAVISEAAAGVEHIRAYGWQGSLLLQTYELLDRSQKSFYYMYAVQRWLVVILNAIATATVTGLVIIALLVINASSQGGLGLALMSVIYLQADLNFLITEWTILETSLGAVARLQSFMKDTPGEKDKDGITEQAETWPSRGEIEFKNVSASYSQEPDARCAINDVSFQIKSGESVAIVGRTGSGKSSIILTLLNFLHHTGTIIIDGVDISNVPREQLRRSITTIPQDHVDIPGTVRDNLLPFQIMDDDEEKKRDDAVLTETLRTVGLWDQISRHGGLDQPLTNIGLSAGQRQLLSLARALMHNTKTGSKIVLMDEVTSNMDYQTDSIMHRVMETKFGSCTRVVVTHRKTARNQCDLLVKLEDGKIVSQERQNPRH